VVSTSITSNKPGREGDLLYPIESVETGCSLLFLLLYV